MVTLGGGDSNKILIEACLLAVKMQMIMILVGVETSTFASEYSRVLKTELGKVLTNISALLKTNVISKCGINESQHCSQKNYLMNVDFHQKRIYRMEKYKIIFKKCFWKNTGNMTSFHKREVKKTKHGYTL